MNEVLESLSKAGCSIQETLEEVFMGNERMYLKQLGRLKTNTCLEKLTAAVASGDADGAFNLAHELKGMLGTLGLTVLDVPCCDVVEITRKGSLEGVEEKLKELTSLMERIKTLLP